MNVLVEREKLQGQQEPKENSVLSLLLLSHALEKVIISGGLPIQGKGK